MNDWPGPSLSDIAGRSWQSGMDNLPASNINGDHPSSSSPAAVPAPVPHPSRNHSPHLEDYLPSGARWKPIHHTSSTQSSLCPNRLATPTGRPKFSPGQHKAASQNGVSPALMLSPPVMQDVTVQMSTPPHKKLTSPVLLNFDADLPEGSAPPRTPGEAAPAINFLPSTAERNGLQGLDTRPQGSRMQTDTWHRPAVPSTVTLDKGMRDSSLTDRWERRPSPICVEGDSLEKGQVTPPPTKSTCTTDCMPLRSGISPDSTYQSTPSPPIDTGYGCPSPTRSSSMPSIAYTESASNNFDIERRRSFGDCQRSTEECDLLPSHLPEAQSTVTSEAVPMSRSSAVSVDGAAPRLRANSERIIRDDTVTFGAAASTDSADKAAYAEEQRRRDAVRRVASPFGRSAHRSTPHFALQPTTQGEKAHEAPEYRRMVKLVTAVNRACLPAYHGSWRKWTNALSWSCGYSLAQKSDARASTSASSVLAKAAHRHKMCTLLSAWRRQVPLSRNVLPNANVALRSICRVFACAAGRQCTSAWFQWRRGVIHTRHEMKWREHEMHWEHEISHGRVLADWRGWLDGKREAEEAAKLAGATGAEEEISVLRQRAEQLQAENAALVPFRTRLRECEAEKVRLEDDISMLQRRLKDFEVDGQLLGKDVNILQQRLRDSEMDMMSCDKDNTRLQRRLKEYEFNKTLADKNISTLQLRVKQCQTEKLLSDRNRARSECFARLSFGMYAVFQRSRTRDLQCAWRKLARVDVRSKSHTLRRFSHGDVPAMQADKPSRGALEISSLVAVLMRRRRTLMCQSFASVVKAAAEKSQNELASRQEKLLDNSNILLRDIINQRDDAKTEVSTRRQQLWCVHRLHLFARVLDSRCLSARSSAFYHLKYSRRTSENAYAHSADRTRVSIH